MLSVGSGACRAISNGVDDLIYIVANIELVAADKQASSILWSGNLVVVKLAGLFRAKRRRILDIAGLREPRYPVTSSFNGSFSHNGVVCSQSVCMPGLAISVPCVRLNDGRASHLEPGCTVKRDNLKEESRLIARRITLLVHRLYNQFHRPPLWLYSQPIRRQLPLHIRGHEYG